jgi:hypothetical protein
MYSQNNFKLKKIFYLFALIVFTLTSCDKTNDVEKLPNTDAIQFGDLKVNLPSNYNESVLSLSLSDLQNLFYSSKTDGLSRVKSSDDMGITLDRMASIANSVVNHYPKLDSLTTEDIAIIKRDFNNIDEETINKNIEVIDSFYNALRRYDLVVALTKENQSPLKVKTSTLAGYYPGNLSSAEFWLCVLNPTYVDPTNKAATKAKEFTLSRYPDANQHWKTQADAFRHVMWNALICEYVGDQMTSIDKCVAWAKKITDAHESGAVNDGSMTTEAWELDGAMDKHNNLIGQNYFKSVAWTYKKKGWFQPTRVASPTSETMEEIIFEKSKSSIKVALKSEIDYYPNNAVHTVDYKW